MHQSQPNCSEKARVERLGVGRKCQGVGPGEKNTRVERTGKENTRVDELGKEDQGASTL